MTVRLPRLAVPVAALFLAAAAHAGPGRLGFGFEVETDGLFSSTLKRITITSVAEGAPAQQAGLLPKDEVEAVNDVPVAGTPGGRLKGIIDATHPGDHLRLKVRRTDGEHLVDITAGALPPK